MKKVFVVAHVHDLPSGVEDIKIIGVYATAEDASAALERAKCRTGFKEFPDGFSVDTYVIGQDHWGDGFVTLKPTQP